MNKTKKKEKEIEKTRNIKTNKIFSVIIIGLLVVGLGFIVTSGPSTNKGNRSAGNVETKDEVQHVTINVGGGYTPQISTAVAGVPTKLIMKSNGTFDCSAFLVIPDMNYRATLPRTGETEIDLGTREVGTLNGLCSMGMYNFTINFE